MEPLAIQINPFKYKNLDAPEKLIRYITRTRPNENRADELLLWGTASGYSYHIPVEELIFEYSFILQKYRVTRSKMCHYVIRLRPEHFQCMNNNLFTLGNYAVECCNYLMSLGHQTCFAIHHSNDDGLHIHFAINSVNYRTGKKLRQYPAEIYKTVEHPLISLMDKYLYHTSSFPHFHD